MNAEDIEIEALTLEQALPARIAAMQFANWGRSTGFGSVEQYERFLRDAVHPRDLPAVLVARRSQPARP
ncbi:MAG: hypothetical protein JOZ74_13760 [Bradyrhizobium sp.]|nr:hypothetical protein [Bradyrhizobium sp.]